MLISPLRKVPPTLKYPPGRAPHEVAVRYHRCGVPAPEPASLRPCFPAGSGGFTSMRTDTTR